MWVQRRLLASEKALGQGDRATGSGKLAGEHEGDTASDMGGAPRTSATCLQPVGSRKTQGMSSGMVGKYNPPTEVPQIFEDQNTISSRS